MVDNLPRDLACQGESTLSLLSSLPARFDMSEQRPHIAIIGAGPTGIEAALAAHQHGFSFCLYEAGDSVASYVRSWGHVRLFSPWDIDVSPRARRFLEALGHEVPAGDGWPTGNELAARVFQPIA